MDRYSTMLTNFSFRGRACRKEYWLFWLFTTITILFFKFVIHYLPGPLQCILFLILAVYLFFVIIAGIAVTVRRLHDIGKSGWWYWINFLPLIGYLILLVFTLLPSSKGVNKYGNLYGSDDNDFSLRTETNPNINRQIADQVGDLSETAFHKNKLLLNKPALKQNSKIEFCCPKCTAKYKVDSNLMGSETECKGCGCKFVINSNLIYNNDSTKFSIKCPMCEYKYELDSSLKGRKVSCANCDTLFIA